MCFHVIPPSPLPPSPPHCSGVWNVAFVSAAVLLKGAWLSGQGEPPLFYSEDFDSDMTFAAWMREKVGFSSTLTNDHPHTPPQGNFMYVSNLEEYGHLINADDYDTSHLHNDMFSLFDNRVVSPPSHPHSLTPHPLTPSGLGAEIYPRKLVACS